MHLHEHCCVSNYMESIALLSSKANPHEYSGSHSNFLSSRGLNLFSHLFFSLHYPCITDVPLLLADADPLEFPNLKEPSLNPTIPGKYFIIYMLPFHSKGSQNICPQMCLHSLTSQSWHFSPPTHQKCFHQGH